MTTRVFLIALLGLILVAAPGLAQHKRRPHPHPHPKPTPTPTPPTPSPSGNAKLLFASEFDAADELAASVGTWRTGWPLGSGASSAATPGEVEIYVDTQKGDTWGPNPFRIANSMLTITATPTPNLPQPFTYTSGCLSTAGVFSFQYGYVELRAERRRGAASGRRSG